MKKDFGIRKKDGFYGILANEDWFACEECKHIFEDRGWEDFLYEVICKKCESKNVRRLTYTGVLG